MNASNWMKSLAALALTTGMFVWTGCAESGNGHDDHGGTRTAQDTGGTGVSGIGPGGSGTNGTGTGVDGTNDPGPGANDGRTGAPAGIGKTGVGSGAGTGGGR